MISGEEHYQSVNANAYAAGRRHAILHGFDKIIVSSLSCLFSSAKPLLLLLPVLSQSIRVIELRIHVADFHACDHQLKPFCEVRILLDRLCQRAHILWIIKYEGWLDNLGLNQLRA